MHTLVHFTPAFIAPPYATSASSFVLGTRDRKADTSIKFAKVLPSAGFPSVEEKIEACSSWARRWRLEVALVTLLTDELIKMVHIRFLVVRCPKERKKLERNAWP
jgi:hypothetical protein